MPAAAAAVLLAAVSQVADAPDSPDAPPPPAIVVTGESLPAAPGDAAYDVETIGRERLAGTASGRLEDVLRDVAGFDQYRRSDARSAHPTSQGATLRGLGGNAASRALVLLDGVPQVDPFGGWVNFPALAPARLGQVRLTRGGGSGVYGPGALAGTIELSSALPGDAAPLSGSLFRGSRDAWDATAALAEQVGSGYATLAGAWQKGDGFTPIADGRGPVDRPAPYEQFSVSARAVAPLTDSVELQAAGTGFHDRRDRGTDFTLNVNSGFDTSLRLVGRGRWGFELLGYLQVRNFASEFASVGANRASVSQSLDQFSVPATGAGGRGEVRPPVADGVELRLGGDWRRVSGQTRELYSFMSGAATRGREAGGTELTVGAFADASWALADRWTLTAGGRIDRWRITQGFLHERSLVTGAILTDQDDAPREGWRPTARAGLAFEPARAIKVRTAAYLGWRLPTLNELYRPYRVGADATAANPLLAPERLRGIDAGIDYRPLPSIHASATVFANRLDDAVANVTLGEGPGTFPGVGVVGAGGAYRQRQNVDAISSRGVELDGAVGWNLWTLTASYAFTDARVHARGEAWSLDGLRPAQTSRNQGSATFAYREPGDVSGSVTVRYVGPQWDDDQEERRLAHAWTADATLSVPIRGRLAAELRVENATNALVEAARPTDDVVERATPRTIWLGLRFGG